MASLRIATYNIRKAVGLDWRRRPERILDVLEEVDADIVALQEADRRFGARESAIPLETLAERAHYHALPVGGRDRSLGWHGNAILVKEPSVEARVRRVDLPSLEPRGALIVELAVQNHVLRVVAMHLGLTPERRVRQAERVLTELGDPHRLPTVIMGDLNEWRVRSGCLTLLSRGYRLLPAMATFHTSMPIAALDRIAVSPAIRVEDCGVHQSIAAARASDHLPLWADIAIESLPLAEREA